MPEPKATQCQSCNNSFTIEPEDFEFYEKIGVPDPTFCPECRMIRRMVWRNERTLYSRKCDLCKKQIISIYPENSPYTVYCQKCWWSDSWDPQEYAQDYDFEKPFFEQFGELMRRVPLCALMYKNCVDCQYANMCANSKDGYFIIGSDFSENISYTVFAFETKDSLDLYWTNKSELCYESSDLEKCYQVFFSQNCQNCSNSWFLYNCSNCSNCIGCVNLRNKQYCIFNKQHTKEEYFKKLKKMSLDTYRGLTKLKEEFAKFKNTQIYRFAIIVNSVNSIGDILYNVKNCKYCFNIYSDSEDCKYVYITFGKVKDTYDCDHIGLNSELDLEVMSCFPGYKVINSAIIWGGNEIQYSHSCQDSSYLFGSIALRNKQYCILNKQYTKEEYFKMVEKIKKHMDNMPYTDKKGRIYKYGEFFPPELSPFAYNETIAQEYFPLNKEQAQRLGFRWKDPEQRKYPIDITTDQIPDNIKDTDSSIVGKIIECAHNNKNCNEQCTTAFKIIPKEYEFYKKMNLPIPRLCPNCRHYQRIKQRNPLKLWKRRCMCNGKTSINNIYTNTIEHSHHKDSPCPNEFYTSYSPDRPEIVYCEKCYQQEVI